MDVGLIFDIVSLSAGACGLVLTIYFAVYHRRGARVVAISESGLRTKTGLRRRPPKRLPHFLRAKPTIEFVTDGRFIDAALFQLAVVDASPKIFGANVVLRQREWSRVPMYVGETPNAVAYFNRRSVPSIRGAPMYDLRIWGDLCLYKGYSLIGRAAQFGAESPLSLADANLGLEKLLAERKRSGSRASVLTMGGDSRWRFESPLLPAYSRNQVEFVEDAVDGALARFRRGEGDMFIGGLPQRLALAGNPEFVEIVSSQTLPTLFAVNAMIYNEQITDGGREAIRRVHESWCLLVASICNSKDAASAAYDRWLTIRDNLGISGEVIAKPTWLQILTDTEREYLALLDGEHSSVEYMISVIDWCKRYIAENDLTDRVAIRLIDNVHETFYASLASTASSEGERATE